MALAAAVLGTLGLAASANASIVFANFNAGEGSFNQNPTFSTTSTVLATSTADQTTDAGTMYEGAGAEKLVLNAPSSGIVRCRFVYNSGNPNAQTFSASSSTTDGYIGFYYKVVGAGNGVQFGINLDAPANTGGTMVGGVLKSATADNNWHLVEWNLDLLSDWGPAPGLGGQQSYLEDSTKNPHTLDSIYFYNMAANSTTTVLIDFVAKSDSGSIANLVPEPASLSLLACAALPLLSRRRTR